MVEQPVGTVTHYYGRPHVAIIMLSGEVNQGDLLHFQGHTTDFQQAVDSMEVEHGHIGGHVWVAANASTERVVVRKFFG